MPKMSVHDLALVRAAIMVCAEGTMAERLALADAVTQELVKRLAPAAVNHKPESPQEAQIVA